MDKEGWESILPSDIAEVFVKEQLAVNDLLYLSESELDSLLSQIPLRYRTKIRAVRAELAKVHGKHSSILNNNNNNTKDEDEFDFINDSTISDVGNNKKPSFDSGKLHINHNLPKFSSNDIPSFIWEITKLMMLEGISEDDFWLRLVLKCIPWDLGGQSLLLHKAELENLTWKEGRRFILKILDPDFLIHWYERILSFKPDHETFPRYVGILVMTLNTSLLN
jgi:hypothetical protein